MRKVILLAGLAALVGLTGQAFAAANCTTGTSCEANSSCGTWEADANGDDMADCVETGWTTNDLICQVDGNRLKISGGKACAGGADDGKHCTQNSECDSDSCVDSDCKGQSRETKYTAQCDGTIKECADDSDCAMGVECKLGESKGFSVKAECENGTITMSFGEPLGAEGSPAQATQLNAGSSPEMDAPQALPGLEFSISCLAGIGPPGIPPTNLTDIAGGQISSGTATIYCSTLTVPNAVAFGAAVPTLGEWGMIVAGVGVLLAGVFLVVRRLL